MADLRPVAREALRRHRLTPRRVALAGQSFNTVYRISTDTADYALRVGPPAPIRPAGALAAEAAWLDRLRARGIAAPTVHRDAEGELATMVDGVDGRRSCVLLDWVQGRLLAQRLTAPTAGALGRLAAALHDAAAAAGEPSLPAAPVADGVLVWHVPCCLGEPWVAFHDVLTAGLRRAESVVAQLWASPPHPPHLLHGDLTPANVVLTPDRRLVPIDFQDLVLGFDVQDLAVTLAALRRHPAAARLRAAFRAGYAAERRWPLDDELEAALVAGRQLQVLNLSLAVRGRAVPHERLAAVAADVRAWLDATSALGRGAPA